jgi:hypothetical protein
MMTCNIVTLKCYLENTYQVNTCLRVAKYLEVTCPEDDHIARGSSR